MSQSGSVNVPKREAVLSRSRAASLRIEIETKIMKNLLNKALIEKYILLKSTEVDSLFSNIRTIKLEGFLITEPILDVLKKTDQSKITTIILRNITFDLVQTCTNFLHFLGINVNLKILILDGVNVNKVNFKELLDMLETFKELEVLEFRGFNITELFIVRDTDPTFDFVFMNILIKLEQLKFLLFTNNIIDKKIYDYLFNDYVDINLYYFIDLGDNKSKYLKYNESIISPEHINNNPHFGEHFMYIIDIDTKKCVNRRGGVKVHTFNNKTNNKTNNKKDVLIDFINERVLILLIFYYNNHSVDKDTIGDEKINFKENYKK